MTLALSIGLAVVAAPVALFVFAFMVFLCGKLWAYGKLTGERKFWTNLKQESRDGEQA